jgi:hypothetical protein
MSDERKMPAWPWIAAQLVGLPVLYVLSSGPTQRIGVHPVTRNAFSSLFGTVPITVLERAEWWHKMYAPLWWASHEEWGSPLKTYWDLFPIRERPRTK